MNDDKLHSTMVITTVIAMMIGSLTQNYGILIVMGFLYLGEEIRYIGKNGD